MSLRALWKGWVGAALEHWLTAYSGIPEFIIASTMSLPSAEGKAQIDHVLVSRFGIFVIEAKNMDGWIFGIERNAQWTQSLYGNKARF